MSYQILIVCTGNTCRSPMAEGILKRMLAEIKETEVKVSSAGTSTFPGWEASEEALQACKELQVDISNHRSSSITLERIRESDLILVMENHHRDRILEMDPLSTDKVQLIGQYDSKAPRIAVDDPVGQPLVVFRHCADRLFSALKGLVQQLPELKRKKSSGPVKVARIAIGADHRGYALKNELIQYLSDRQYEIADCGTYSEESADHPDQAFAVAELVRDRKVDRGILICSNGVGMCIAANKVPGAYAALVSDAKSAKQTREHNGANILCLPGAVLKIEAAQEIVEVFLTTQPLIGENHRYQRRREKIRNYEKEHFKDHLEED